MVKPALRVERWADRYIPLPVLDLVGKIADSRPEELTPAYLLNGLTAGLFHLWLAYEREKIVLAMFVELRHYYATSRTFARIAGIAGSRVQDALPMLKEIEQWAQSAGASKVVVPGREGWKPLLRPYGYELESITLSKQLGDGHV